MTKSLLKNKTLVEISKTYAKFVDKERYDILEGMHAKHVELRRHSNKEGTEEIYILSGNCLSGIQLFEDRIEALRQYLDIVTDLQQIESRHLHQRDD